MGKCYSNKQKPLNWIRWYIKHAISVSLMHYKYASRRNGNSDSVMCFFRQCFWLVWLYSLAFSRLRQMCHSAKCETGVIPMTQLCGLYAEFGACVNMASSINIFPFAFHSIRINPVYKAAWDVIQIDSFARHENPSFNVNSLRQSDAYMRHYTNHHWFR